MKQRWIALLAALTLCLLPLAACAADPARKDDTEPTASDTGVVEPADPAQGDDADAESETVAGGVLPNAQNGYVYTVKIGQSVDVDLDGDGTVETVYYESARDTGSSYKHKSLTVNGEEFVDEFYDDYPWADRNQADYYIFDIDASDHVLELGIVDKNTDYGDYSVRLYHWENGELVRAGGFGYCLNDGKTFTINGDGTVLGSEENDVYDSDTDTMKMIIYPVTYGMKDGGMSAKSATGLASQDGSVTWRWDFDNDPISDHHLVIEGTGEVTGGYWPRPLQELASFTVTVSEGVTGIGKGAFDGLTVDEIDLPASLTSIGDRAFYFCGGLTEIRIPDGVTSIGEGAFYNCSSAEIHIPASVTIIGECAFSPFAEDEDVTIYAPAGSYAHTYAQENDIPFQAE